MSGPEDHTILKHLFHTEKCDRVSKEDLTKLKTPHISLLETDSLHCCCFLLVFTQKRIQLTQLQSHIHTRLFIKLVSSLLLMDLSAVLLVTLPWSHNQVSFAKGSSCSITVLKDVSGRYSAVTPKRPLGIKHYYPSQTG